MNKNKIFIIIFLMGFALLGLIFMQVSWIRKEYALRETKFNQLATDAINKAISRIEMGESVHFIARSMGAAADDSIAAYFSKMAIPPPPDFVFDQSNADSVHNPQALAFFSEDDENGSVRSEIRVTGKNPGDKSKVTVSVHESNGSSTTIISNDEEAMDAGKIIMEKKLIKVEKDAEKVKLRARKLHKVIEKMAFEFEHRDFDLLDRVAPELIDSLIGIELLNNGIALPYMIELNFGKTDSVIWKSKDTLALDHKNRVITANLFPDDLVNQNSSVKVIFSDAFGFFMHSMWLMLVSSTLFTLIVILTFSYTVYVIFRQKKLADIKNDFVNNMTHEFKTPIATIKLATAAINNSAVINDIEKVKYYTGIIADENERMNSHVESILQIAQFDRNAFVPDMEPINIHDVIDEAINKISLQLAGKGGKVHFTRKAEHFILNGDKRYFLLVLLNLLDNAIKYCDADPIIEITTYNEESQLIIKVNDNGIGMSKDMQQKIFDKFYRVPSGDIHKVKGFGLGLSYVKAIVVAHNGKISVRSELGKGSCFEIILPVESELNN